MTDDEADVTTHRAHVLAKLHRRVFVDTTAQFRLNDQGPMPGRGSYDDVYSGIEHMPSVAGEGGRYPAVRTLCCTGKSGSRRACYIGCYTARSSVRNLPRRLRISAGVSRTENPRVGGSTPSLGTTTKAESADSSVEFMLQEERRQGLQPFRGHSSRAIFAKSPGERAEWLRPLA